MNCKIFTLIFVMFLQISICYSAETCAEIGKESRNVQLYSRNKKETNLVEFFSELRKVDNVGKKGFTQKVRRTTCVLL